MTENCTVTPDVRHADLTAENEDCPSFDLDKYVAPFWEGNTVYNECVFPITGADGIGGYLIVGLTFMTAGALLLLEYRRRKRANGAV